MFNDPLNQKLFFKERIFTIYLCVMEIEFSTYLRTLGIDIKLTQEDLYKFIVSCARRKMFNRKRKFNSIDKFIQLLFKAINKILIHI